jgi:hypothetical protein
MESSTDTFESFALPSENLFETTHVLAIGFLVDVAQ